MPNPSRSLPPKPSLEQQKKLAKDLLNAFRAGDASARERVRMHVPDKSVITLADAQFVLAREYGFESWPKLKDFIDNGIRAESVRREFRRVVEAGNASALRALLERDAGARALVNARIFSFDSPALPHVSSRDDVALVDVLLDFGADPNRRTDWELGPWHPLHAASEAVAERLIAAGAEVDACAAAHLGRVEELRRLLDAEPERVHERGGDGQTPLHFASNRAVADLLLQRGADLDARDYDHRGTPAQWMLAGKRGAGRYDLARYLVERGASVDIFLACALGLVARIEALLRADPAVLDLRTHQGEYGEQPPGSYHIYTWSIGQNLSPLQVAAQFEHDEAVTLLKAFASDTQRFMAACARADGSEAEELLHHAPDLLERLSLEDKRALADAGWAADARAVKLMLELGFDPAIAGASGGTVLHNAAWEGSVECVQLALGYDGVRALVNAPDLHYRSTPLGWCCHGAVHCGNPNADHGAVARLLLLNGARPTPELVRNAPTALAQLFRDWNPS